MPTLSISSKKTTHTVYGALLRNALLFNEPLPILPNSTLNQKFGVAADQLPVGNEKPIIQYFGIGLNGVVQNIGINGLYQTKYREYQPRWGSALYSFPFIIRPVTSDLSIQERANYRMRKVQTFDGVAYACYYLRKIDLTTSVSEVEYRTVEDGNVMATAWEPELSDLNPTALEVNPNQVLTTGDDYLSVTRKLTLPFSPSDIQELLDAADVILGDASYANISELTLVSGIDRAVQGDFNGVALSYTEACYAQVNAFIKTMISAPNQLDGATLLVDAGANEPLLIVS
jgi:hypothetical protein